MPRSVLAALIWFVIGVSAIIPAFHASGSRTLYADQVAVLMYHHIHDTDRSSATITTKLFRDQLSYLRQKGYRFITMDQFRAFMNGGPVPENAVLVTFDDGYESFYTNAYPILRQMNVPAVNFVITGTLDQPKSGYVPYLSPDDIERMTRESDLVSMQCHTHALHDAPGGKPLLISRLTVGGQTETDAQYGRRVTGDIETCVRRLQPLNSATVDALAYPYGEYTKEAADLARQAGIKYAFTIVPAMATRNADPLSIPRLNAGSPRITPQKLHHAIMRRIVAVRR